MKKHFLLCLSLACSGLVQAAEQSKREEEIERDAQEATIADGVEKPSAVSSCGCTGACGCSEQVEDCVICREELSLDLCSKTPCNHTFHTTCLNEWKKVKPSCPLCRTDFRPQEEQDQLAQAHQEEDFSQWPPFLLEARQRQIEAHQRAMNRQLELERAEEALSRERAGFFNDFVSNSEMIASLIRIKTNLQKDENGFDAATINRKLVSVLEKKHHISKETIRRLFDGNSTILRHLIFRRTNIDFRPVDPSLFDVMDSLIKGSVNR
jgi:hypothetical protein